MYTLLQELKDTGAQTPAVGMLVEPLLPRALRKEVDKQKTLKGDVDTDLYAIGIGEQHLAHSCSEEGTVVDDGFVVPEGPRMAKLCIKMQEISDALDLVPVSQRDCVEYAVAHAIGQGLDRLMECCQVCKSKYAKSKYHQPWLCALKQAISQGEIAKQEPAVQLEESV